MSTSKQIKDYFTQKGEKCGEIARSQLSKITKNARLPDWSSERTKAVYSFRSLSPFLSNFPLLNVPLRTRKALLLGKVYGSLALNGTSLNSINALLVLSADDIDSCLSLSLSHNFPLWKMFHWEPERCYCCAKSMVIWFSTEYHWRALMPFWFSADDIYSFLSLSPIFKFFGTTLILQYSSYE